MGRVYAIALNTFREALRDRVLHGVLSFGVLLLLFTLALGELSLHEQLRVVRDVGLASISLLSVIVAIFLGSSLLYKEIEKKTLYVVLPKPIRRSEFLLGKYVGICMTAAVFIMLMGALQLLVTALQVDADSLERGLGLLVGLGVTLALMLWRARDRTIVALPWAALALLAASLLAQNAQAQISPILAQLALICGEVSVLSAIALLFSAFSTPFLTGVFTLGVWLLGRSADDMEALKEKQVGWLVASTMHSVAEVAPNLYLFVPGHTILQGSGATATWPYVGQSLSYAVLYSVAALLLAALIFQRRDFI